MSCNQESKYCVFINSLDSFQYFQKVEVLSIEGHLKLRIHSPFAINCKSNLFSISSYSRLYSGIVDFLKFASHANSKHFLTGQKKSADTSLKCSKEATMYAGLATALNSSIFLRGSVKVSFCSNLNKN